MALEELGLEIVTKGFAKFAGEMKKAEGIVVKTADGWTELGKAATKAEKPITAVNKQMKMTAKSASDTLRALQPMGIALSAVSVAGMALVRSSTMIAARNQELAVVLQTVGRNAGYTAGQLTAYENKVKALGITTSSARQSLVQMAQANIDLAHSTDLARLAQDAAVIAQVDSSEAFSRLITIIQTGNVLMGRRLGLNLDFAAANKRLAASLGITTDALTQEQRMQARVNEVMRQGATIAGTYEAAMTTAGKQMRSLNRHWEEARAALGEAFLPMLSQVVQVLGDLLKWFNSLSDGTKKFISSMLGVGTVMTGVAGALILLIPQVLAFSTALATAEIAAAPLILAILAVAAAAGALFMVMKTSAEVHEHHAQASSAWAAMLEKEAKSAKSAGEVADAYLSSLRGVTQEYNKAPAMVRPFIDLQGMVAESTLEAKAAIEKTAVSYQDYRMSLEKVAAATGTVIDAEGKLTRVVETGMGSRIEVIDKNYLMSESAWEASHAFDGMNARMGDLSGIARDAAAAINEVAESQEYLEGKINALKESMAGAVGKENAEYVASQEEIRAKMEEVRLEIIELEAEQGHYAGSTADLTVAQYKAQVATGKLSDAQQALSENTDPEMQLQLEAAVAKSSIALDKANAAAGRASGGYVDNSERIGELQGDLGDLEGSLEDLATAHREAMNQIIYDMMMARLATDGWTEAEVDLATQVAESMGLIDGETAAAMRAMNSALTGFAEGEGVASTVSAIERISGLVAGIPRDININIRANLSEMGIYGARGPEELQHGGPARAGRPYWVGERGPEIFVPGRSGNVISNSQSATYQYNLTTQSITRPGALAQEFGAMAFVGAGASR